MLRQHIVVSHGGANVGMTKLGLGYSDIFTAFYQVGGIGMPKRMDLGDFRKA